nr:FAD-binding protein [Bacilli bacterium]
MDKEVLRELRAISGAAYVLDSEMERYAYSYDSTPLYRAMPDVVIQPAEVKEIAAILKVASRHRIPIVSRGSGTNLSGGTVPLEGGIVLHMSRMHQLKEIDTDNLTATFESGLITADLHREVEAVGLFYPPDPGSLRVSTMGGNVAECAGGMRGLKYGVTKDYVMGIQAVLPDGSIVSFGGKNAKDVAGYDITRLLVGSEGTLAVITEITAKLLPLPETKRTIIAFYREMVDAAKAVSAMIAARIIPASLEFLDQKTMKVVEAYTPLGLPLDMAAMLLIQQDGPASQVEQDVERILSLCKTSGAVQVDVAKDDEEGEKLMSARRNALSALARVKPTTILEDATVPRSRLAQMVTEINRIADHYGVDICTFGHAGDGNLHPTCLTDERDTEEIERVEQAFAEIFHAAIRLGGTVTGEHGVGIAKAKYLDLKIGEAGMELMKRVKAAFDPHGIMNPGKMFAKDARRRVVIQTHEHVHGN